MTIGFFGRGKRSAFALILSVGAMAFMVLLTLTLSSLVSSKIKILSAQKQARQARSNALLGMSVAISDLQRALGKDNAVSFSASVLDSDAETPKIDDVRTPYALGVLEIPKDRRDYSAYELQQEQMQLARAMRSEGGSDDVMWLISSQKRMKSPISESPEDLSEEVVTLAKYKILENYPEQYGGAVNSNLKSAELEVRAGKVPCSSGAYAFWISDESQKAKINLMRPDEYLGGPMGDALDMAAPADSRVAQICNTSFVDELCDLGLNPFLQDYNEENARRISKISNLSELALLSPELGQWAKDNVGDWTACCVGIPADVTQGRLKEDLSAYIYGGYGLEDKDPIVRGSGRSGDSDYSGADFELDSYDRNLPTFGLLRTWANLAENVEGFTDGVEPRAHVIDQSMPQQHGIYPMVNSIKWIMLPGYHLESGSLSAISKGGGTSIGLSMMMWPRIVMWNPNNVKLNASDYVIRIYMPFRIKIGSDPDYATARTRWRVYENGAKKGEIIVKYKATAAKRPHFGALFKSDVPTDNKMPAMNFLVENLELRPGESIELNVKSPGGKLQEYKDVPCNSMGGANLLEPSMMGAFDGPNATASATIRQCIKIDLGISLTVDSVEGDTALIEGLSLREVGDGSLRAETEGGKVIELKPYSHLAYEKTPSIYSGKPSLPYLETSVEDQEKWRIIEESYEGSSKRGGYEILLANGTRLFKSDMSEWESMNTIIENPKRGRTVEMGLSFGECGLNGKLNDYLQGNQYSAVINPEDALFESDMGEEDMSKNCKIALVLKESGDSVEVVYRGIWESAKFVRNLRLPDFFVTNNMIFTAANYRAPSLTSGNLSDSAVLKKAGDSLGEFDSGKINFALAHRYMKRDFRFDMFFAKRDSSMTKLDYTGMYSWKTGEPVTFPPGEYGDGGVSEIITNDLLKKYLESSGDGYGRRFGELLFMSGYSGYPYDTMVSAPFDYPRGENDIMSLGLFSRANLSPMVWQPTFAFANTYVSPYMDRENIIEQHKINENELIDICYLLNASVWDRFFLSSLPQKDSSSELASGMRLPNTRYFLKSVPLDKSELMGSDEAFKMAAAHIGIDGAFNVNSTSYEAWRAVLGGLLGTKKKTTLGEYINDTEQSAHDPDTLAMPNPGDIRPLFVPDPDEHFTWMDAIVGRSISESEIDMLAREIVKEVKIRAPFFSLSDFVNRRLMKYSEAESDENLNYQSLMGTLAAAIRKSELIEDRPKHFFNDKTKDFRVSRISDPKGYSYAYNINTLSAFLSRGSTYKRDLGEQVKADETQYIEHAIATPYDTGKWAHQTLGLRGLLSQSDLLSELAPFMAVRGDTFTVRAYGECKNSITGTLSKAYCEAVVQRSSEPVEGGDDVVAPQSSFGRRFNIVSFRWLTPTEL